MNEHLIPKLFKILFITSVLLSTVTVEDDNKAIVRIKDTVILGKTGSFDGNEYKVFKGIPYAEPPIGDLRFRKPMPMRQWPEKVEAYDWPNPCYHHISKSILVLKNTNLSEDCLKLNIWTPAESLTTDTLKPVLLYIHGGALLWGAAHYDGQVLVTRGDIIFVDIQYRLSTLGFLYTGKDEAPGNVGLLDQALALEWVSDNIRYFGGDPQQITIMGMSAGSWSVSMHILSPMTRNLFRYAIMQSAAMTDHISYPEKAKHAENWLKGAELVGCNDGKDEEFTEEIIECLRKADAEKVQYIPEMPELMPITFMPMVVVDGHFLPDLPSNMLKTGDFKQNLSLMISTVADEGSMFMTRNVDPVKYDKQNPQKLSLNEAIDELKSVSKKMSKKFVIDGEEAVKVYFNGLSDASDADLLRRTTGIAFGDFMIQCPTIIFGKEVFRNSNFKSNVYQYYWNAKTQSALPIFAKWWGPSHAEDAIATFGMPLTMNNLFSQRDKEMSEQMIQALTTFVRTGSPGEVNGTVWPKFFAIDDNIVSPYYEFTSELKRDTTFGVGLKINECEYLWRKHILFN